MAHRVACDPMSRAAKTLLKLAGSLEYPAFIATTTLDARHEPGEIVSFGEVKDVDPGHEP